MRRAEIAIGLCVAQALQNADEMLAGEEYNEDLKDSLHMSKIARMNTAGS